MNPLLQLKVLALRGVVGGIDAALRLMPARVRGIVADRSPVVRPLDYGRAKVLLHVGSEFEYRVRLKSASKEPDTVKWIETRFRDGDVFYDIGANVGAYSLIAAALFKGRVRVYAFEPSAINFSQLVKNVSLNGCAESVMPLPVALGDAARTDVFNYRSASPGAALHALGSAVDEHGRAFSPAITQQVLVHPLDNLRAQYGLAAPSHIKIDVDGGEFQVLEGAKQTLRLASLRTVLIEASASDEGRLTGHLAPAGFHLAERHTEIGGCANFLFQKNGIA